MAQNTVYITINNGQNSTFICPTTPVVNILASGGISGGGGGSSFYQTIKDPLGVSQPQEAALQFLTPFSVADNPGVSTQIGIPTNSITNAMLVNNGINIAGNTTPLGGSVTQDQITGLSSMGLIKRTGANTLANAVSGTDYQAALGFTPEDVANKATDFTTLNNTLYPTTQAVENEIYVNMYFSQTPTF